MGKSGEEPQEPDSDTETPPKTTRAKQKRITRNKRKTKKRKTPPQHEEQERLTGQKKQKIRKTVAKAKSVQRNSTRCQKGKKSIVPVCSCEQNEKKNEDELNEDEIDLDEAPCTSKSLFPSEDEDLTVSDASSDDELDD